MCATKARRHKENRHALVADGNLRLVQVGAIYQDDFEHFVRS